MGDDELEAVLSGIKVIHLPGNSRLPKAFRSAEAYLYVYSTVTHFSESSVNVGMSPKVMDWLNCRIPA